MAQHRIFRSHSFNVMGCFNERMAPATTLTCHLRNFRSCVKMALQSGIGESLS